MVISVIAYEYADSNENMGAPLPDLPQLMYHRYVSLSVM